MTRSSSPADFRGPKHHDDRLADGRRSPTFVGFPTLSQPSNIQRNLTYPRLGWKRMMNRFCGRGNEIWLSNIKYRVMHVKYPILPCESKVKPFMLYVIPERCWREG